MAKTLTGTRILDFSRYLAGPYCTTILADMGAEVIKVEQPGGWEDRKLGPTVKGRGMLFELLIPRNKKAITLNLRGTSVT